MFEKNFWVHKFAWIAVQIWIKIATEEDSLVHSRIFIPVWWLTPLIYAMNVLYLFYKPKNLLTKHLTINYLTVSSIFQAASLKNDMCLLVDERDNVIGTASKRECHRVGPDGMVPLHRAFSVLMFNSAGELLVQKRASQKVNILSIV